MAKVWSTVSSGVYEATDTIILQTSTRDDLVREKEMLESTISGMQLQVTAVDADIAAIDAL
ncbi:MAG: hypothetical protein V3W20_07135 [Candidatus Neomarinimicrobiota bacterium]